MNKDKVYLKGYVIGHAADTLGYQGLMVQLENLDVVEIDKNLVHKDINEPKPVKLKDVIARIKDFDSGTQKVWLNEILNELGSDYGTLKYKAGYEQGKFESGLAGIERAWNKPVVPQFVADYIAEQKKLGHTLSYSIDACMSDRVGEWYWDNSELFALAWIDGYTVEKEPKYTVKFKATKQYLCNDDLGPHFDPSFRANFTKSDLEKLGLGWVFECEGMEVEKVGK